MVNLFTESTPVAIARIFVLLLSCAPLVAQTSAQTSSTSGVVLAPSVTLPAAQNKGKTTATSDINSADLKTKHAVADLSQLPKVVPAGRPVIGIALEGGGALGLAHIGVLQWMEENHIPIDRIAGTSMGALVGGFYASGLSPAEMQRIAMSDAFRAVFAMETPYIDASFRRREDRRELPQAIQLGLKGGVSVRNSLLVDTGLNEFLVTNLNRYNRSDLDYNNLPIPYRCVATDLNTMQPVVFQGGPMPQSVHASIAIPGIFSPLQYRNHYLVDGAIMDNLPTDIVKEDLHSDVVIAVDLSDPDFSESDVTSVVGIFARAFSAGTARNERIGESLADILISADTSKFSTTDYGKATELIIAGYTAAEKNRTALIKYALADAAWQEYLADRQSRVRPQPTTLQMVKVDGGSAGAKQSAESDLARLQGKSIDPAELSQALRKVQGNGTYEATFETFAPTKPNPSSATEGISPDTGVIVRLSEVRNGPPFLLFGADATAVTSNVSRNTVDLRLIDQNLGGFGSELRADFRFGFLTQTAVQYYRPLTRSGYYIQPNIGILRQPVYLWQNQQRISERFSQQAGGGVDIGRTFNRNVQASLQWREQVLRWHLVNGYDGTQSISGSAQTATMHLLYDRSKAGSISAQGSHLGLSAGALFHAEASRNAPLVEISAAKTFKVLAGDILALSAEGNTYFRRNVAEPLRFTVGGPLRLSASSIDEYRGTDDFLARAGYLRRIAALPTGYGQGLYAGLGYEGAEIWAPERRAILRQDGLFSVIAATPLGAITIGGAIGDAGRRKIFFSYGRVF